ncbi:Uncharacterised protein [Mycobacteroides abscessus subsp. abscessus]|nr:Uncharacterised protein [Mycobacteroides abscessus subsp. abscessus]
MPISAWAFRWTGSRGNANTVTSRFTGAASTTPQAITCHPGMRADSRPPSA